MSEMWTGVSSDEMIGGRHGVALPTLVAMSSTMLTKRRAVDHCRTRSALCRMR